MYIIQVLYQLLFSPVYIAAACIVVFAYLRFASFRAGFFGFLRTLIGWGAIVGVIGFALGFFGPMIHCFLIGKDCPQGPLLGFFITGPLGLYVGMLGAAVGWVIKSRKTGHFSPAGRQKTSGIG
jgi:hypothetical protein